MCYHLLSAKGIYYWYVANPIHFFYTFLFFAKKPKYSLSDFLRFYTSQYHNILNLFVMGVNVFHEKKIKKNYLSQSSSDRDVKSCQVIASDKSNLLRKFELSSENCFPCYSVFYSFGGRIRCYNCGKLYLQMSTTVIFGTSQNNV